MDATRHDLPRPLVWMVALAMLPWVPALSLAAAAEPGSGGLRPENPDPVVSHRAGDLGQQWDDLGHVPIPEDHPWLGDLWLLGRYNGQYHWAEGSNGSDEAYESRRFRLGFQARMVQRLTLHAQAIAGFDFEPAYNGFTELWAAWQFDPALTLTVGQQKHRFTHDRNASSRYINYLERGLLTNMFRADYTPAVTLSGNTERLTYYTGVFSNATGRDIWNAFTELDAGPSWLGALYVRLDGFPGTEEAWFNLSAVESAAGETATNLNRFDSGVSSALILVQGAASLIAEVTGGWGSETGDAVGLNLQPALFLNDEVELALRYQIAGSNHGQGLTPQVRYEQPAGLPPGDLYQAGYVGMSYLVARHRLKVMAGVEYATLGGEDVWTASTAFRFFFGPHASGVFPNRDILHGHGQGQGGFLTPD